MGPVKSGPNESVLGPFRKRARAGDAERKGHLERSEKGCALEVSVAEKVQRETRDSQRPSAQRRKKRKNGKNGQLSGQGVSVKPRPE